MFWMIKEGGWYTRKRFAKHGQNSIHTLNNTDTSQVKGALIYIDKFLYVSKKAFLSVFIQLTISIFPPAGLAQTTRNPGAKMRHMNGHPQILILISGKVSTFALKRCLDELKSHTDVRAYCTIVYNSNKGFLFITSLQRPSIGKVCWQDIIIMLNGIIIGNKKPWEGNYLSIER